MRLLLELEVVDQQTGHTLADRRIYVYQTDDRGDYAPEADSPGAGAQNARALGLTLSVSGPNSERA